MKTTGRIIVAFILLGMCVWTYFFLNRKSPYYVEQKSQRVSCANNLRQISVAFRIWANDNDGAFPFNVSTNSGGVRELCESDREGFAKDPTAIFKTMHVELGESPKVLVCPEDRKKWVASLNDITSENITYRVHVGTNVTDDNSDKVLVYCPVHGYSLLCNGTIVDAQKKEVRR